MDYKLVLDALPDLIYVTKEDGITSVFYNKRWYEYTGLTEEEAADGWKNVVDPRDVERISKEVEDAVKGHSCYEVEVRLKFQKLGDYRWFLSRGCPILDSTGQLQGYVGTSLDIHDRKTQVRDMEGVYERIAEERQRKIEELEEALNMHQTKS